MTIRKAIQITTLFLFFTLLYQAAFPFMEGSAVDLFLRLDPLIAVGTWITSRSFLIALIPGMLVLLMSILLGRVFCSYICPMGTSLELVGNLIYNKRRKAGVNQETDNIEKYRFMKFALLALIIAAATAGISLVYLGSPLSIITRIYGLFIYPIFMLVMDSLLQLFGSNLTALGFSDLAYTQIQQPVFDTGFFIALLTASLILLLAIKPRFWCRYLCPAGALMGLFSHFSLFSRSVGESCTGCGKCSRNCPMGAIPEDPKRTVKSECITCLECRNVCPVSAITFSPIRQTQTQDFNASRRSVLLGMGTGLITAGALHTSIDRPGAVSEGRVFIDHELVRPPGALPESDFLDKCIRCGECMKACATNTLQPTWFQAGLEGIFTPALKPRFAACATNCNVCGQVCPTGAIRRLPLIEKNHAKIGTAAIDHRRCLVWQHDKKCLVCDEVCPYNAVSFKAVPGLKNPAPHVTENRCLGCGWCENKCPVYGPSAIRVNSSGQVRLAAGSYVEKASELGLKFKVKDKNREQSVPGMFDQEQPAEGTSANGQSKEEDLPEGFTSK